MAVGGVDVVVDSHRLSYTNGGTGGCCLLLQQHDSTEDDNDDEDEDEDEDDENTNVVDGNSGEVTATAPQRNSLLLLDDAMCPILIMIA